MIEILGGMERDITLLKVVWFDLQSGGNTSTQKPGIYLRAVQEQAPANV